MLLLVEKKKKVHKSWAGKDSEGKTIHHER
jgi:hypothetical protein